MKPTIPEKRASLITAISLTPPIFVNANFTPATLNLIYGENGSGKTTLAHAISEKEGLTWADGTKEESVEVLHFDRTFAAENMQGDQELPGVFLMGKANIDTDGRLKALLARRRELEEEKNALAKEVQQLSENREKQQTALREQLWQEGEGFRKTFPRCLGKARTTKKAFAYEAFSLLREPMAPALSIDELRSLYDTAFSDNDKKLPPLMTIEDPECLDHLEGADILARPIMSRDDSPFATFLTSLSATDWVRYGHDHYHEKAADRCPYCQQTLPADFEEQMARAFDEQYKKDLAAISDFKEIYRKTAGRLYVALTKIPPECSLDTNWQEFQARLVILKSAISENIKAIEEKENTPSKVIELSPLSVYLGDLSDLLASWNQKIQTHNETIDHRVTRQNDCQAAVRNAMHVRLAPILKRGQDEARAVKEQERQIETRRQDIERSLLEVKSSISEERSHFADTSTAMEEMNRLLDETGFSGFHLEDSGQHTYRILRSDGSPATGLSDGEKQFLGYLYFASLAFGTKGSGTEKQKILVIDDPTALMDKKASAAAASLTRELVTACLLHTDPVTYQKKFSAAKEAPIAQLFLLTHDSSLITDIAGPLTQEWDTTAFFLLEKENDATRVEPLIHSEQGKRWMNVLPALACDARLWQRYRDTVDPRLLLRTCRTLIFEYFLQAKHLTRAALRSAITQNAAAFQADYGPQGLRIAYAFILYLDDAAESYSQLASLPPECALPLLRAICQRFFFVMREEMYFRQMSQ